MADVVVMESCTTGNKLKLGENEWKLHVLLLVNANAVIIYLFGLDERLGPRDSLGNLR